MPKSVKPKCYAVKIGLEGPAIYDTWDECKANVSRYPGAIHKSFASRKQAEDWLGVPLQGQQSPSTTAPSKKVSARNASTTKASPSSHPSHVRDPVVTTSLNVLPPPSEIVLSPEQKIVLERVTQKRNVFFTGSAGTGKSVLLREIIRHFGGSASSTLAITASTGIASVNIGGTTLHSWAGIGLGQETATKFCGKILHQKMFEKVLQRWRDVETLILDEISLIDGALFDTLEEIARTLRKNKAPFGGIQLVISGDFCQLPPVPGRPSGTKQQSAQVQPSFAFEAKSWDLCLGPPVVLTRVYRQKDQAFVDMLNALRLGQLSTKIIEEFTKLSRPVKYIDGIEATELFPTRQEVEKANSLRLEQLAGPTHTYPSFDQPGLDGNGQRVSREQMERLLGRLVAPKSIVLKVGAQVMLIKNLVQGKLVNGSIGRVTGFSTYKEALAKRINIPGVDENQNNFMLHFLKESELVWPLVHFTNDKILCVLADFTVNNADGEMEARRSQIPLILAWALSVHKSQGQTLERVRVNLGRTFEHGQAYVALSRATSMQSLQVLGFHPSKCGVHPRVLTWNNQFGNSRRMNDDEMDDEDVIAAYYS